jgi:hypothetical protein
MDDLMEDIAHTLGAMLKDLLKSEELRSFLRDHGWKERSTDYAEVHQ